MRYGSKFMMIPWSHLKQITLLLAVRKIFWAMSFQNGGLVATLDFGLSGWGILVTDMKRHYLAW